MTKSRGMIVQALRLISSLTALIIVAGTANAATMTYEYQFEISGFANGIHYNTTPPLSTLQGTVTFSADNGTNSTGITPISAQITQTIGGTVFNALNILVDFDGGDTPVSTVHIGGSPFGVAYSNWNYDDFIVNFGVNRLTGEVISTNASGYYTIGSMADIFHSSSGSAVQISPTPLPAALPLFLTMLGSIGFLKWRRGQLKSA